MRKITSTLLFTSVCFSIQAYPTHTAESEICPRHLSLVWSEQVEVACFTEVPDYKSKCEAVVQQLASIESPTVQQGFDLAVAQQRSGDFEDSQQLREELWASAARKLQYLHKSFPDYIRVLFELQILSESVGRYKSDETRPLSGDFPYYQRILKVAPDCSRVRKWLLEELSIDPHYLSDIDRSWVNEISRHLLDGYELARNQVWKMEFARMLFVGILFKDGYETTQGFQLKVFHDLDVINLPNDDSRAEHLNAVCDYSAFHMQFTQYCLDGVQKAPKQDVNLGRVPNADVLEAMRKLSHALTREPTMRDYRHPIELGEYHYWNFPFFLPRERKIYHSSE